MMALSPLNRRRLANFKANRRGFWSFWIFLFLFVFTLFAEFVANDEPFLVVHEGEIHMPIFKAYPETTFGGQFPTETDYTDPYVQELIGKDGWMLWPLTVSYTHLTLPTIYSV